MQIRSKDFIETEEGLIFAVLVDDIEQGRHLCFLRYIRTKRGFCKLATEEAERLLSETFPQYRFHSVRRDVDLPGLRDTDIVRHYRPQEELRKIIRFEHRDQIQEKVVDVVKLIENRGLSAHTFGITGSLMIGAQTTGSDIDLVIYDREHFNRLREIVRQALSENLLAPLNRAQWQETYARRGCSLSLEEYIWHEQRKYNKAMISGTKIDFTLITETGDSDSTPYRKIGPTEFVAAISEDRFAFDTPARYAIIHPEVGEILCFTHTYAGQAFNGESVIARGMLEESDSGRRRLVIGSSREAPGEYMKVIRSKA